MASSRRRYLVSYDIANAKRLRRVAKTMEASPVDSKCTTLVESKCTTLRMDF